MSVKYTMWYLKCTIPWNVHIVTVFSLAAMEPLDLCNRSVLSVTLQYIDVRGGKLITFQPAVDTTGYDWHFNLIEVLSHLGGNIHHLAICIHGSVLFVVWTLSRLCVDKRGSGCSSAPHDLWSVRQWSGAKHWCGRVVCAADVQHKLH